jgi:hypothetical protein
MNLKRNERMPNYKDRDTLDLKTQPTPNLPWKYRKPKPKEKVKKKDDKTKLINKLNNNDNDIICIFRNLQQCLWYWVSITYGNIVIAFISFWQMV